jgi:hypothetical protein
MVGPPKPGPRPGAASVRGSRLSGSHLGRHGFRVTLNQTTDRRAKDAFCSPPSRDPCRRRGRLFAPDGCGRRGDARAAQGASRGAAQSEDQGAQGPYGQDHRRQPFGGVCQCGGRRTLRCGDPARDDRPRAGCTRWRRIRFRIGVNLGDVIVEGEDIFGDGVNVAARLEALAEPGEICVSRIVRDQVRDKLDLRFQDRGEQQLKNIARPVHAIAFRSRSKPRSRHLRQHHCRRSRCPTSRRLRYCHLKI